MKKFLLLAAFIVTALGASAQTTDFSLLGHLGYQTNYERFAIGAQGRYNVAENFRLAADVTFFAPKNKITGLDINLNLHYVLPLGNQGFQFYPLAGFGMQNNFWGKQTVTLANGSVQETDSFSRTKLGFNLGAGITYNINARSFLNLEGKFMFADDDNAVFLLGYGYRF